MAEDLIRQALDNAKDALQDNADSLPPAAPGVPGSERDSLLPYLQGLVAKYEWMKANPDRGAVPGLRTGFRELDLAIGGLNGGHEGELIILGAAPGAGKTTFLNQVSDQLLEQEPEAVALFVSLEQSASELKAKTLSRMSGVSYGNLLRGRLSLPEWKDLCDQAEVFQAGWSGRKYVYRPGLNGGGRNVASIRQELERVLPETSASPAGRGLVIVDYLQLLDEGEREPRRNVDMALSGLAVLSRDLRVPVVAISATARTHYQAPPQQQQQQGRSGSKSGPKNKRTWDLAPSLGIFKESGGVEYSADQAWVLSSRVQDLEEYARRKKERNEGLKLWLTVVKHRGAELKQVPFRFFKAHARFDEDGQAADWQPWKLDSSPGGSEEPW